MTQSNTEFLDVETVASLAKENLPSHYHLTGVNFDIPGNLGFIEIRIEFHNTLEEGLQGMPDDIAAFQKWSNSLIDKIRTQWPKEAVRISFSEKLPPSA
jgi:hypothetical protein